ncbi:vesicle-mediated transport [Paramecium bursaria]
MLAMLQNIYSKQEQEQIQTQPKIEFQPLVQQIHFKQYNPVTFLFPELVSDGKLDFNKTIKIKAIIIHFIIKLLILLLLYQRTQIYVLLLIAFEFWIDKNYCAKRMIGIIWWSQVDEDQQYCFEKVNDLYPLNKYQQYLFWVTNYCYIICLIGLLFLRILDYGQFIIILIAIFLCVFNTLCFKNAQSGIVNQIINQHVTMIFDCLQMQAIDKAQILIDFLQIE